MKNLLLIFSLFVSLITSVKALMSNEPQFKDNQKHGYRNVKSIPTIKYELTNPNLSILQIKDWYHFVFQNKIYWWKIDLKGSSYKNTKLFAPLHLRYNMLPEDIEMALHNSFHPQEIKLQRGSILILD